MGEYEVGEWRKLFTEGPEHAADFTEDTGRFRALGFEDLGIADEADGGGVLRVSEAGLHATDLGWLGAIDVPAEDFEGEFIEAAHEAGATGEINSRADGFHRAFRQAGADEF